SMTPSCDKNEKRPAPWGAGLDEFAANRVSAYAHSSGSSPRHRDAHAQQRQQAVAAEAWVAERRAIGSLALSVGIHEVKRSTDRVSLPGRHIRRSWAEARSRRPRDRTCQILALTPHASGGSRCATKP